MLVGNGATVVDSKSIRCVGRRLHSPGFASDFLSFCFFFVSHRQQYPGAGCNDTVCPRMNNCTRNGPLTCAGGNVITLCETRFLFFSLLFPWIGFQDFERRSTERIDIEFHWTIDGIDCLVRSIDHLMTIDFFSHLCFFSRFNFRSLSTNKLVGTIPSSIGQLKSLNRLCVPTQSRMSF